MARAHVATHSRASRRWALLFVILVVLADVAPFSPPTVVARERIGNATRRVQVWEERSRDSRVLLTLPREAELIITGRARQGFYPVRVDDIEGWALTGSIAIDLDRPGDAAATATLGRSRRDDAGRRGIARETVNLRAGPGTNNRIEVVIPAGREVALTGEERAGFVGVRFGNTTGWVAREYVATDAVATADVATDRPLTGGDEPKPVLKGNPRHMTPEEIIPFIYAAADYYGQPREDMLRVAQCESDLVAMAVNEEGGSYGIFQFKTGTWLSTPYAEYDIFDPRASAYAAGWMWSVGRRNEWVCQ